MNPKATFKLDLICGGKLALNLLEDDNIVFEHYNGENWNELFELSQSEIRDVLRFLNFANP